MAKVVLTETPKNLEAEKYVIANALADIAAAKLVVNELTADDFTDVKYRHIFEGFLHLYNQNKSLGASSLVATLSELNTQEIVGGSDFINELLNEFIDFDSLEDNIRLLQDKRVTRDLIIKTNDLTNRYFSNHYDTDLEFLSASENEILNIIRSRRVEGFKTLKDISSRVKSNIATMKENGSNLLGYSTGLIELDRITNGMQKGQVTVIAARPGVGKTALGLNICFNVAKGNKNEPKKPVLLFSAEMGEDEIGTRLLASATDISSIKISSGNVSPNEMIKLSEAIEKVSEVPLYVNYCNGTTIGEIVAKTTKFYSEHPDLALIMVDYIGLIKTGQREESTRIEIGKISHALKKLALDLKIPVIVISQVRRTQNEKPQMSDLKESGDIEQDADKVILLYRQDYEGNPAQKKEEQNPAAPQQNATSNQTIEADKQAEARKVGDPNTSIIEVSLVKNRNGSTGTAVLLFFKTYQRFADPKQEIIMDYKLKNSIF